MITEMCKARQPLQRLQKLWDLWKGTTVSLPNAARGHLTGSTRTRFGYTWQDPYSWMEQQGDGFYGHAKRENAYTRQLLNGELRGGIEAAHQQILSVLDQIEEEESKDAMPKAAGGYLYYTDSTGEYPHYKRRHSTTEKEQTLLNINDLVNTFEGEFLLEELTVSPSHRYCAYTLSDYHSDGHPTDDKDSLIPRQVGEGNRLPTTIIRDIDSGEELDVILGVKHLQWFNDDKAVLYSICTDGIRPDKVFRHWIGSHQSEDEVQYEEEAREFFISLTKTKDDRYLNVSSNSKTSSEVYLVDACSSSSAPKLVQGRQEDVEYFVEHVDGDLIILTNAEAPHGCIMRVAADEPSRSRWESLVPERPDVGIEDLQAFKSHIVLFERRAGRPGVSILPFGKPEDLPAQGSQGLNIANQKAAKEAVLEEVLDPHGGPPSMRSFRVNPEAGSTELSGKLPSNFSDDYLMCQLSSPVQPGKTARISFPADGNAPDIKAWETEDELPRGQSLSTQLAGFKCRQEYAEAQDGAQIPITVVCKAGKSSRDGLVQERQPCFVQIYGAYGISLRTHFCPLYVPLLEAGWNLAFLHVRGGGEKGRRWHHVGRQSGKLQALQDGSACLDYLMSNGYATRGSLGLSCESAGGVLGALLLMRRPRDFGAAVLRMPFLDVLTVMTDESHPLTPHEWAEWGDPKEGGIGLLRSICPYQNLDKLPGDFKLPPTLVTAGLQDTVAPAWMAAKWVAGMRNHVEGNCPLYLHLPEIGHSPSDAVLNRLDAIDAAWMQRHITSS